MLCALILLLQTNFANRFCMREAFTEFGQWLANMGEQHRAFVFSVLLIQPMPQTSMPSASMTNRVKKKVQAPIPSWQEFLVLPQLLLSFKFKIFDVDALEIKLYVMHSSG